MEIVTDMIEIGIHVTSSIGKTNWSNAVTRRTWGETGGGCMLAQAPSVASPPVGPSSVRRSNLTVVPVKDQGVVAFTLMGVTSYQYMHVHLGGKITQRIPDHSEVTAEESAVPSA